MRNIQKIIESRGHKLDGSEAFFAISIKNKPYMRLAIEGIGCSPDGRQLVSVAHYYEQEGDLMRDPEMVFVLDVETHRLPRTWHPVSFQQDGGMPLYQEAIVFDGSRVLTRLNLSRQLKSFARTWNKNLGEQGFVKAALRGCDDCFSTDRLCSLHPNDPANVKITKERVLEHLAEEEPAIAALFDPPELS